MNQFSLVM